MKKCVGVCSLLGAVAVLCVVAVVEGAIEAVELPGGVFGPESIAFDCRGEGPYASVSDGRILKWKGPHLGWTQFALTSPNRYNIIYPNLSLFFSFFH